MTATEGAPMARPGLAWAVLGSGVVAYVLTVMQRTSLAAGSALVAVLVLAAVRNGPGQSWQPAPAVSARQIAGQVRTVWQPPGTRLGFFGHKGTQFSMMVFALLWGVPYLVSGQHLSPSTAGALVMLFVLCSVVVGPIIGLLTTRHPTRRSWILLGIIAANALIWIAVLTRPGAAPLWLLVAVAGVLVTRRKARRVDAARGVTPRPLRDLQPHPLRDLQPHPLLGIASRARLAG